MIHQTVRLSHLVSVLCLALVLSFTAQARQQAAAIAGHWEGAIQIPGTPLNIQVDVKSADGKLSGTITMTARGAREMPLANINLNGADFAFDLSGVPGNPQYRGKLSADGQKIEGTFTQAGQSFPCNLARTQDPAVAAKAALEGLDAVALEGMKKFDVPGMAVAIVKGKEVIFAKGFGQRNVEKNLPITADTIFAIGSSTKAFTTLTLGTLVNEGKVEWDKPVRNYIPWFRLYDPVMTERLSVRDLVTHRSGLPRHDLV